MVTEGDSKMNLAPYKELSDNTLAALANKGLLRRAQKDLEAAPPQIKEERADALVLLFARENCTVTLPAAGPAKATCTCPADACCRHMLAGALWLRARAQEAPAQAEDTPKPDELLQSTEAQLIAWAGGRKLYRQMADELAFGELEIEMETEGKNTLFRLPHYGQVVRALAGAGLDGVICSCKHAHCEHAVAAVLYYQAQHGRPLPVSPEKLLTAKAGTPRTREEVLTSVEHALAEMIALGLARLSKTTEGRFLTLAISAHGVDLPALSQSLRVLGSYLSWQLERDVRASTPQLLTSAARVYALAFALRHAQGAPPAALVGEHRSRYYGIGNLELVGVGAEQWRTRSGYAGLSLYFWDMAARRWTSWSDVRPTIHTNVYFSPHYRYLYEDTWDSAPVPAQVSRSQLRLSHAQRNKQGRLSSREQSQAFITSKADLSTLALDSVCYDDWSKLAEHIAASHASGLGVSAPLDNLVIITPAAWDEAVYDQMTQTLVRPVRDAAGRLLPLALPYNADWPFAVDTLQTWNPQRWDTWGILGGAFISGNGLELRPISLLNRKSLPRPINSPVLHLTLDALQANTPMTIAKPAPNTSAAAAPAPAASEAAEELEEEPEDELAAEEEPVAGNRSAVSQLLRTASFELEQLAERGARVSSPALESRLHDLAERLRQVGVASCAAALTAVARHLEANRHQITPETGQIALALLRAYYLLRLALEQSAVTEALAAYRA
jgi:hypothetical protein